MNCLIRSLVGIGLLSALVGVANAEAQLGRVAAEISPIVPVTHVRPGAEVKVGLTVRLPEGFHVQSNTPRDPSPIPTTLTLQPPDGVTAQEIVFPAAMDLPQRGAEQPLAVFGSHFAVGVRLVVSAAVAEGDLVIPGRLRYQACDDTTCSPPVTTDVTWTLRATRAAGTGTAPSSEIDRLSWGAGGIPPTDIPASAGTGPVNGRAEADAGTSLDAFDVLSTTGGYLDRDEFLSFVRNAEQGVRESDRPARSKDGAPWPSS